MKIRNLGIILLIISFILFCYKKNKDDRDINYHNKIINEVLDSKNNLNIKYIEIPKYNIKRIIKNNINDLDNNYVIEYMKNNNLIVLAGHNINLVFHKIHYLNKNDLVYLYYDRSIKYKVINKVEVDINDFNYLNKRYDKNTLILITCTSNVNKRLLVILEKIT